MSVREDYALDLDRIVKSKGGNFPSWLIRLMEKILHVKFLNGYLVRGYEGVEFCTKALEYLKINLEVEGLENIPDDGTLYTFASNHPLGGIDGVAMGSIVGENFGGKVRYLVNDLLMNLKGLAPMCVPINKTGGQSRNLPALINEAFHSDNHMLIFPAGLCSRKIDGKIQDLPWGKAFINKSIETGRSIVPVHFIARNSNRFYRIANLCKKLKLKFNVAMVFLPDEMYKSVGGTFKVVFGKPIKPEYFTGEKTAYQWAQWVREEVYKL